MTDTDQLEPTLSTDAVGGQHSEEDTTRMFLLVLCCVGLLAVGMVIFQVIRAHAAVFETPYQAVTLTDGEVFFGRLEGWPDHPVLRNPVFLFKTGKKDEKGQDVYELVARRSSVIYESDAMYLPVSGIKMVEPVAFGSLVSTRLNEWGGRTLGIPPKPTY